MFEYQISVSKHGEFFFRTDWMQEEADAHKVYDALSKAFGDYSLRMIKKPLSMFVVKQTN